MGAHRWAPSKGITKTPTSVPRARKRRRTLNFILVAGSGEITIIPQIAFPAAGRVGVVFLCVLPRQQVFEGPETAETQVPNMKFLLRLPPDACGKRRSLGPEGGLGIRPLFWSAASAPAGGKRTPQTGQKEGAAHGPTAVDIGAATREIPSPQTSKSATVFAGFYLTDRTSIRMKAVRNGGDLAPVWDGADDDKAVGSSRIAAGEVVKANCAQPLRRLRWESPAVWNWS